MITREQAQRLALLDLDNAIATLLTLGLAPEKIRELVEDNLPDCPDADCRQCHGTGIGATDQASCPVCRGAGYNTGE